MSDLKTKPNNKSVSEFIQSIDSHKQRDCKVLLELMREVTGKRAKMWGDSIIGFGKYHYKYKSGREGDWFITGFSPRKHSISIYIMPELAAHKVLLGKLGKHKSGVCCLYVNKLDDIDLNVLRKIMSASQKQLKKIYDF